MKRMVKLRDYGMVQALFGKTTEHDLILHRIIFVSGSGLGRHWHFWYC